MIAETSKKKRVPKLRFSGFKGTWNEKKLQEFGKFMGGGTPSTSIPGYWNGNIPWISSSDLIENKINQIDVHRYITETAVKNSAAKKIPPTSILIVSRVGLGKVCICDFLICTSQDFTNITEIKENIGFLTYSILGKINFITKLNQGTSIKGITTEELKNINLSVPSLPEQKKIADFLTAVDRKIDLLRKKKALWEKYKKGLMQKIFSQEIRFKKEDGSDYPDWEEKRLGDVGEINPNIVNTPDVFHYIDLESVKNGRLSKTNRIERQNAPSRAQRTLSINDILYQTVRPYQRNNYFFDLTGDFVASTGYAQIRAKQCPKFIFQLIHVDVFVFNVLQRCTGTSYPAINSSDLKKIKIKIPQSIGEQEKIASFLESIDKKISLIDQQIQLTEQFKKGLLQQMFI